MSNARASASATDALNDVQLLDASDVDALPWTPVAGCPGVSQKVLWHLGGFTQALVRYEPGASTLGEPHLAAHHHIWVTQGELTFACHRMTAGSYAHVPPGQAHSAVAVGAAGCTLLQMHRPHPPVESQLLVDRAMESPTPHITRQGESSTSRSGPQEKAVGPSSYAASGLEDSS